MSAYNLQSQGENVHLTFVSTAAAAIASPMVILDANMSPRPLKTFERLVIDDLEGTTSAGTVSVIATSSTGATAPTSTTLLASFNTSIGLDMDTKEGISITIGVTPSVLPEGTASTAVIRVVGNGRIVEGTGSGAPQAPMIGLGSRPNWREALTPNGNF